MSRAETLAGLAEAIAGHVIDRVLNSARYGCRVKCSCGEIFDGGSHTQKAMGNHHAAVALAWLEGHGWAGKAKATDLHVQDWRGNNDVI